MKDIRIGFIGLGGRGYGLLEWAVLPQKEQVVAVCDVYEDRVQKGAELVEKSGQAKPAAYADYMDVIKDENVNTVIVATAWETHVEIALAAMYAGKAGPMKSRTVTTWWRPMRRRGRLSCSWRTAASAAGR